MYKTQGGDIDIPLSDGTTANFQYGDYNPKATKKPGSFVGKKLEMKHPNTATPDLEYKLKNAKLSHIEPSGTKIFYTEDGVKVVVDKNNRVISTYKPDINYKKRQGSPANTPWEPDAYDGTFQQHTPVKQDIPQQNNEVNLQKAFALPSRQEVLQEIAQSEGLSSVKQLTDNVSKKELNRLYNVYSLRTLENTRKVLNKAINKAAKEEDNEALASLMQIKESFDQNLLCYYL